MDLQRIIDNTTVDYSSSYNGAYCWIWTGALTKGYGAFRLDGRFIQAHRYSYECVNGEIDDGLVIRHMCHNRACCHPDHLRSGSHLDNYWDSRETYVESHRRSVETRRNNRPECVLTIGGKPYRSIRDAADQTGLDRRTIRRYTNDGVFDIQGYRNSCLGQRHSPRV